MSSGNSAEDRENSLSFKNRRVILKEEKLFYKFNVCKKSKDFRRQNNFEEE